MQKSTPLGVDELMQYHGSGRRFDHILGLEVKDHHHKQWKNHTSIVP